MKSAYIDALALWKPFHIPHLRVWVENDGSHCCVQVMCDGALTIV